MTKKINQLIDNCADWLDRKWLALPVRKQRAYTLLFFIGYVSLTAGVIMTVWNDAGKGKPKQGIVIEHIKNPIFRDNAGADSTATDTTANRND